MAKNIGFVSTRFAGTDGVSLESAKWAEMLWDDKHVSFWYSGRSDRHPDISYCIPEAYFGHLENVWLMHMIWKRTRRSSLVTERIQEISSYLKKTLYDFVNQFDIDILVAENALAIPMHIPLALALTEFLAETQMPAIAHHHDFHWERTRYAINAVSDYLEMAFPPILPNIQHTVINRAAQEQLSLRKGVSSMLIPNVFDFANPPPQPDVYARDVREQIGLRPDDVFILQPTRIVPRKGIEHAIKLVGMLGNPDKYKLVISHDAGDEGFEYRRLIEELAREENVDLRLISDRIGDVRQFDAEGKKIFTLWDLYPHADLVTYPSTYEGFGNALLEAIYFKVPLVVNRYSIFIQDIEPKGFKLVVMDGIITKETVLDVRRVLDDPKTSQKMVDHNYRVARQYYSYRLLRRCLRTVLTNVTGYQP